MQVTDTTCILYFRLAKLRIKTHSISCSFGWPRPLTQGLSGMNGNFRLQLSPQSTTVFIVIQNLAPLKKGCVVINKNNKRGNSLGGLRHLSV